VYTQSPAPSFNTHLSIVLTSHHQQQNSEAKNHGISSRHRTTAKQTLTLTRKARKKHQKSMTFHPDISHENCAKHQKARVISSGYLNKKTKPITFTVNAQEKKVEEPWFKYDIYK
jgi:hypothetical protein